MVTNFLRLICANGETAYARVSRSLRKERHRQKASCIKETAAVFQESPLKLAILAS